jgi:hypothetical protein
MTVATRTKTRGKRHVHKSYLNLIVELPLASIKSQQQMDEAQAMIDRLLRQKMHDEGEELYLDALSGSGCCL